MGKGFGLCLAFLFAPLVRPAGRLERRNAETLAPTILAWYMESVAGKIQQPGVETRFLWRIPASHCRRFFVALFMGALYPEHPCFHCIVYGAVMREASCLPVPQDRFSTPHDCPIFCA